MTCLWESVSTEKTATNEVQTEHPTRSWNILRATFGKECFPDEVRRTCYKEVHNTMPRNYGQSEINLTPLRAFVMRADLQCSTQTENTEADTEHVQMDTILCLETMDKVR